MEELLRKLASLDISLVANDNQLDIYDPNQLLTDEILTSIKVNKLELLDLLKDSDDRYSYKALPKADDKPFYVLSSSQKRIYFLHELDRMSLAYNMPQVVRLKGNLDKERLTRALGDLIQAHEILRTAFEVFDEEAVQRVSPVATLEMAHFTARDEQHVQEIITAFIRPFDLTQPPLFRVGLIEIHAQEYMLMVDMHHIIADGVSQGLLIRDFIACYNHQELPGAHLQYKDFAEWQQSEAQQKEIERQKQFWIREFSQPPVTLELPTDFPRQPVMRFAGRSIDFFLDEEESRALKSLAERERTTLFTVVLSLYNILLSKVSNNEEVVIGTPVAGRAHADLENMVGMFVNMLPLRNSCRGDLTFSEFLSAVKERTMQCFDNQLYPYEELIDVLKIERDTSRNPLFDVLLVFQNFQREELSIPGVIIQPYRQEQTIAKFDITLTAFEDNDRLFFNLEYRLDLFSEGTVHKFIRYFRKIITTVIRNVNIRLSEVEIIADDEKQKILRVFNDSFAPYPSERSITELFAEIVARVPDKTALSENDKEMTYATLDLKSSCVAEFLIGQNMVAGTCVGVLAERSISAVIAILGVLKAGGVYVPIDTDFPKERVQYVLDNCKAHFALFQSAYADLIPEGVLGIDIASAADSPHAAKPAIPVQASDPAYVMYTSGSVGNPKGVIVTHRNVIRLIRNTNYVKLDETTRILQTGAPAFDATTFEIWGSLLNAGTLCFVKKEDLLDTASLGDVLVKFKINTLWLTASLFNQHAQNDAAIFGPLTNLLVGGEALTPHFVNLVRGKCPHVQMINGYGPTENTTFSVCHRINERYVDNIPIGRPISNATAYVCDRYGKLLPVGIAGELWVGGDGVAKGYLNNEDLTQARFVRDPYRAGGRLYKTGDMARWLENGTLEYLGRIDQQIKLRGFRIELEEIQYQLGTHESIAACVATCVEQANEKYITAYYVARTPVTASDLRDHLSKKLPAYMVPSFYVHIDKMPLTVNGKLDVRALPPPVIESEGYVAPSGEIEEKLAGIWSGILKMDRKLISADKSFFELGGHSLKATILVNKILSTLNVSIPLRVIFKYPDIRSLARYIQQEAEAASYSSISKTPSKPYYALSSAQKRLYFLYTLDSASLEYNMPQVIGLEDNISTDLLERTLHTLINRHESLRTYFEVVNEEPVQAIAEDVRLELPCVEVPDERVETVIRDFIKPFDLSKPPLLRAGLIKVAGGHRKLVLDMHHIISDLTSNEILAEEFNQLLNGKALRPLRLQYKDYAEWQNLPEQQMRIMHQQQHWLNVLSGRLPVTNLPTDTDRKNIQQRAGLEGGFVTVYLNAEQHGLLTRYCHQHKVTTSMLLYSLFAVLMSKLSAQQDMIIGLSIAGRHHEDLEKIIGLFVNALPIRCQPQREKRLSDFIQEVRNATILAYENQECQFNDLVDKLGIQRIPDRNPLFDIMFNIAGQWNTEMDLSTVSRQPYLHTSGIRRFDMTLNVFEYKNTVCLKLQYDSRLFTAERAEKYLDYLMNIISSFDRYLAGPLSDIGLERDDTIARIKDALKPRLRAASDHESLIAASYHQERLWFIDKFETGYLYDQSPVYHNLPLILDFEGSLNLEWLQSAVSAAVTRHPVLRTRIVALDERPFQQIAENATVMLDLEALNGNAQEMDKAVEHEVSVPFVPGQHTIRGKVFRSGKRHYRLVLTLHHIIADRYSLVRLAEEILSGYGAIQNGMKIEAGNSETAVQYADFSRWQQTTLAELDAHLLGYWKIQLGGKLKALELPTDHPRAMVHVYHAATRTFSIPEETCRRLLTFESETKRPAALILMAAFKLLLQKYCQHDEIVIGTSVDNRAPESLSGVIGPIANLVVIRSSVASDMSFNNYIGQLAEIYRAALKYSAMPFDKLVKELAPEKDMSRTALFDVLYQYTEKPGLPSIEGAACRMVDTNYGYGKYDINLLLQRNGDDIEGRIVFNRDYFQPSTIGALAEHFCNLLDNVLRFPGNRLGTISILSDSETQQVLNEFDFTEVSFPSDRTIIDFFAEQVQARPDHIAVKFKNESLTYEALNRSSNRLAALLRQRGVKRNDVVGLLLERSLETVVGMLAILKAGGAYLPIDVDYPQERIAYLIDDSRTNLVVTSRDLLPRLAQSVPTQEIEDADALLYEPGEPENINQPTDLCYVIYTSGTTGNPKGVMVEHRNVVRLFFNNGFQFDFGSGDVWTMFHSPCFDFSVWEMYGALLLGGTVVIIPKAIARDPKAYLNILVREKVTILNQTPSAFYSLAHEELARTDRQRLHLRYVIFGGEALSPGKLGAWRQKYPDVKLINMFGITETTVHVTYKEIRDAEIRDNVSNIGKPIPTLSVYLLDQNQMPVPRGARGELYVGGSGVTRGYLGKKELTDKKFIRNPFRSDERLYRSGDLGRVLPSGEIEYLGRIDHQVQLRGFRIELGEVESCLNKHPEIKDGIVILSGAHDDQYLVAYYCADKEIELAAIRHFLAASLPEYMVPAYFVRLPAIPLTLNGKLDRSALPDPVVQQGNDHVPPRSETEKKLAEVWSEVLRVPEERIGIHESFFDLGGHSLRAAVLCNRILKVFNVEVPLKEIFKHQQIEGLARLIDDSGRVEFLPISKAESKKYHALSSAQKRLYFLYEFDKGSLAYNMPQVLVLEGQLDKDKMQQTFNALIQRHESLRTAFKIVDDQPVQEIQEKVPFVLEYLELDEAGVESAIGQWLTPFDLAKPPLVRACLARIAECKHVLAVDMHHIIADGISQGILIRDFMALYKGEEILPMKLQYKDFAEWQNLEEQQRRIHGQRDFWISEFKRKPAPLDLPADFVRPPVKTYAGNSVTFEIGPGETAALRSLAERENSTMFMILMAAYNVMLSKLCNQDDIVIGTPVAGRTHADLDEIIGVFLNTLPLRNFPDKNLTFRAFLKNVRSKTIACFENQAYPYEEMIDVLKIERDSARNPLFSVMFTYQKDEAGALAIPGITVKPFNLQTRLSKFDLTLDVYEGQDHLFFNMDYSTELFRLSTIERFIQYFRNIVSDIVKDADQQLSRFKLVSGEEEDKLLTKFNNSFVPFDSTTNTIDLFHQQVLRTPDNTAVICNGVKITYSELNASANRLGQYLRNTRGVRPGDLVGVLLGRSDQLIVAILAILKTGAAYIPIDPNYPQARIALMIEQSGLKCLITEEAPADLPEEVVLSLSGESALIQKSSDASLDATIKPDDRIYVIFTSGSTGTPKGVMVRHDSFVNLLHWYNRALSLNSSDCILLMAPISFDLAQKNIFAPLLCGASLCLSEDLNLNYPAIASAVDAHGITVINAAPSAFYPLLDVTVNGNYRKLAPLKYVVLGGEPIQKSELLKWHQSGVCNARVMNSYGPTECTDVVSYYVLETSELTSNESIPIGKPIDNTQLYILDADLELVPEGVPGEVCIGGAGVSKGYLNNEALTHAKFIKNPHKDDDIIYRTGDVGRWREDGNIQFLGRRDDQVKIRGFRLELGEIENQLSRHGRISQVAVVAKELNSEQVLVAYYTSSDPVEAEGLRSFLLQRLPDYMVPSFYVQLEQMPVTPSGKIDKRYLRDLAVERSRNLLRPSTEIQEKILRIWGDVLKIESDKIGINSNYFEVGGHSLNIIALTRRINAEFNCNLSIPAMFRLPTISSIEDFIVNGDHFTRKEVIDLIDHTVMEADDNLRLMNDLINEG